MFKAFNRPAPKISTQNSEQENFRHLVMDIAWYGAALPSVARFMSIYAIALGATASHLAWISSGPALITLISATLSGWWRSRYPDTTRAVFWPSFWFRFIFLLPALTPFLPQEWQVYWLVFSVAAPAFPQGISSVMFLVMMREAVEENHLMKLLAWRAFALNVTVAISGLIFGAWLDSIPFPTNYQVMYIIAFFLTMVSLWHVDQTRPIFVQVPAEQKSSEKFRPFANHGFQRVSFVVMLTHIAFFSVVPLVPLYLVEEYHASAIFIAIFALFELAAGAMISPYMDRISKRIGNRGMIAFGMMGTCLAAGIIVLAVSPIFALISAWIGGAAWTLANNGIFGFFSQSTPQADKTRFTTIYTQTIFLGVFIGPLVGSFMVNQGLSLMTVILIAGAMRLSAGLLTWLDPLERLHKHEHQALQEIKI